MVETTRYIGMPHAKAEYSLRFQPQGRKAALDNGADSICFGVEQLNMRARSTVYHHQPLKKLRALAPSWQTKNPR